MDVYKPALEYKLALAYKRELGDVYKPALVYKRALVYRLVTCESTSSMGEETVVEGTSFSKGDQPKVEGTFSTGVESRVVVMA